MTDFKKTSDRMKQLADANRTLLKKIIDRQTERHSKLLKLQTAVLAGRSNAAEQIVALLNEEDAAESELNRLMMRQDAMIRSLCCTVEHLRDSAG